MPDGDVFNVGIGTSHIVNSGVYSSVRVFCNIATNETSSPVIRFLIDGVEASNGNPSGVSIVIRNDGRDAELTQTPLSSGSTEYTCEATIGNSTFTKKSFVNVMGKYSVEKSLVICTLNFMESLIIRFCCP